jgi:hypothetical protein
MSVSNLVPAVFALARLRVTGSCLCSRAGRGVRTALAGAAGVAVHNPCFSVGGVQAFGADRPTSAA